MKRVIELNIEAEDTKELREALIYLFMWNMPNYDKLIVGQTLCGQKEDIMAFYENTETFKIYVIGAIWNEDRNAYSFHS